MDQRDLKIKELSEKLDYYKKKEEEENNKKRIVRISMLGGLMSSVLGLTIYQFLPKEGATSIARGILNKDYQRTLNQAVVSCDMLDASVLDEKGLGGYFEELTGFHMDEHKLTMLNQCDALGKIKLEIDNTKQNQLDNQETNSQTISNKVLKKGLVEAEEYIENVIYYDNKDLPTHYSITFTSIDEKAFMDADITYKISDSFVADTIHSYVMLNEQETDLNNYIEDYDQLIDGLLKMTFCEVSLESDFFGNQMKLLDTPKTYAKK